MVMQLAFTATVARTDVTGKLPIAAVPTSGTTDKLLEEHAGASDANKLKRPLKGIGLDFFGLLLSFSKIFK